MTAPTTNAQWPSAPLCFCWENIVFKKCIFMTNCFDISTIQHIYLVTIILIYWWWQLPQYDNSLLSYLFWRKIFVWNFLNILNIWGEIVFWKWKRLSFCRTRIPVSNTVTALEVWFHLLNIEISYLEYESHHHLSSPIWIKPFPHISPLPSSSIITLENKASY